MASYLAPPFTAGARGALCTALALVYPTGAAFLPAMAHAGGIRPGSAHLSARAPRPRPTAPRDPHPTLRGDDWICPWCSQQPAGSFSSHTPISGLGESFAGA